jgi:hypothetical protein
MAETTILGIDPAMDNVGWMLLKMDTEKPLRDTNPQPEPDWILQKDTTGVHTYQHFERLNGGTLKSDKTKSWLYRVHQQVNEMHEIIYKEKPTLLALEAQLDQGENRNPTGLSVQNLIIAPFYHTNRKIFRRYVTQLSGSESNLVPEFIPKTVVLIRPERLQSVAHQERSTKGSRVVARYKKLYPEDKRRLSQHEADAFFIAVHAGRFWATCINNFWPRTHLTTHETPIFLESAKAIIKQEDEAWWQN